MGKYFRISSYISHIWLCNCSTLNFLIYEKKLNFFFYQCMVPKRPWRPWRPWPGKWHVIFWHVDCMTTSIYWHDACIHGCILADMLGPWHDATQWHVVVDSLNSWEVEPMTGWLIDKLTHWNVNLTWPDDSFICWLHVMLTSWHRKTWHVDSCAAGGISMVNH